MSADCCCLLGPVALSTSAVPSSSWGKRAPVVVAMLDAGFLVSVAFAPYNPFALNLSVIVAPVHRLDASTRLYWRPFDFQVNDRVEGRRHSKLMDLLPRVDSERQRAAPLVALID